MKKVEKFRNTTFNILFICIRNTSDVTDWVIFGNRYPSKKLTRYNGDTSLEEKKYSKKQFLTKKGDMHTSEEKKVDMCNSTSSAPKEEINFIKLNKERISVANKLATKLNNGVPPTSYRKGVVPKYIY